MSLLRSLLLIPALGIALLLTAIAWSPTLFTGMYADTAQSTVVPEPRPVRTQPTTPPGTFSSKSDNEDLAEFFQDTELWPYTKLSQRYDQRGRQLGFSLTDR